ncbi:proline dehydrogenase [Actinoalloteichus hoggarensis]|uniref:proline dehydrogenase family protein n=1 Tax=Actinoalloteichus hoggarensis TaxID=1470176 RepID=UPI000B8A9AF2|nr:proline dehydrogenase family protein [Actinoalloteichus hoggarensis]MBB5921462.1 proline dehydrogenase [Actinoalloteichus hoggarensis]
MNPLRSLILAAAGNDALRRLVATTPISRDVVRRFVAGETTADAVAVARDLVASGLTVTLDHLGEDTTDKALAESAVQAYLDVLERLREEGLASRVEVSVKLSALGQVFDERLSLDNAARICAAAEQAGTTVTLDMEDHTTTDSTLRVLAELRRTWPGTGAVLQSYLRRTRRDAQALAGPGSRVRLCKGAYAEPESVAFPTMHEVDRSYVQCANDLLAGEGYPMFATHDPRLIEILTEQARLHERAPGSYEFQMLHGVRTEEQLRLSSAGEAVRVYLPYGQEWYGYLMRRLAERPANTALFLRALTSRR